MQPIPPRKPWLDFPEVIASADYLLVDDFIVQGGTLANLKAPGSSAPLY